MRFHDPYAAIPESEATGKEITAIEHLLALQSTLNSNAGILEKRIRSVPGAWAKFRTMQAMLNKIMDPLCMTLPSRRREQVSTVIRFGTFGVRVKGPVREKEWLTIRDEDLAAITQAAMANTCRLCVLEGREIKNCTLRKALTAVAAPNEPARYGCEYQNIEIDI